jgi:ThiF family
MSANDDIANRHLLAADGLESTLQSEEQYVRIVVSELWSSSRAGQLLTACLVNLLCRQVKIVRHIEIVALPTRRLIRLPSGDAAESFPACLQELAEWAVNGAIAVSLARTGVAADHTIYVGDPGPELIPDCGQSLVVIGDGWRAWVGDVPRSPGTISPTSGGPLGPFLAATLAAGEIFKRSRGLRRGKFLSADGYSLWSGGTSSEWNALVDGPAVSGIFLPPTHIVGAGAVANALGLVLANLELSSAYLIPIDDDKYDKTNLNRCLLAGWQDVDHPKVDAIARALRAAGLEAFPFNGTIRSYVAKAPVGLRSDVARRVDDLNFDVVASCVDKGISRQDIQGLEPHLLFGGSTLDLQAKANWYTGCLGSACLACFNPAERKGEMVRSLESQLRMMPTHERGRFLTQHGLDAQAVNEYLAGARCGGLGESALKDFATRLPPEFSTGFVSLGAGLMLAAALLQGTVFLESAPSRRDMCTLNYRNGGFADAGLGVDDACEWNCQRRGRAAAG